MLLMKKKWARKKTFFLFNVNSYKNSFSFLEICCKIKKNIEQLHANLPIIFYIII